MIPRTQSIYSDLGFILLGFLAADRGGASLRELFGRITAQIRLKSDPTTGSGSPASSDLEVSRISLGPLLTFDLPAEAKKLAAPTLPLAEDPRRGRLLTGEVHDNYAAALGGAAGHAGLFGTAPAVGAFARTVL